MAIYLIGGIFGMIAIFVTQASILEGAMVAAVVLFGCLLVIWRMERVPLNR